jgi:diguanylate cyclase (GGDEF)-like protein
MGQTAATNDRAQPGVAERRAAIFVACFGILVAAAASPFGNGISGVSAAVPPTIISAAVVTMIVTAAVLRYFYQASNFPPHAILGIAFACTGGLLVPYVFATLELATSTPTPAAEQFAGWLWVSWHAAFVLMIGGYVWAESYFTRVKLSVERERAIVRNVAIAAVSTASGWVLFLLIWASALPRLQTSGGVLTPTFHSLAEELLLALCAAVCAALTFKTGLNKTLHLWLAVVLVLFACEVFIDGEVARHSTAMPLYAGLAEGIAWQSVLLVVLLRRANDQLITFVANNRKLAQETMVDALTGLLNRRGFDERMAEAIAETRLLRAPTALLALDIDNFKRYNDHYGHVAGDEALRTIGNAIRSVTIRPRDVACRVGGEEFAIILPMTDEPGAMVVADRIRAAILQLRLEHAPDASFRLLSASIGIAVTDGDLDATSLRERADQALYRAKRLGRNRIARYRTEEELTPQLRVV